MLGAHTHTRYSICDLSGITEVVPSVRTCTLMHAYCRAVLDGSQLSPETPICVIVGTTQQHLRYMWYWFGASLEQCTSKQQLLVEVEMYDNVFSHLIVEQLRIW